MDKHSIVCFLSFSHEQQTTHVHEQQKRIFMKHKNTLSHQQIIIAWNKKQQLHHAVAWLSAGKMKGIAICERLLRRRNIIVLASFKRKLIMFFISFFEEDHDDVTCRREERMFNRKMLISTGHRWRFWPGKWWRALEEWWFLMVSSRNNFFFNRTIVVFIRTLIQ